jgi:hypothetical protein
MLGQMKNIGESKKQRKLSKHLRKYGTQSLDRHALVFFGTPHAGPSSNLQVGLGMACAKIVRSLPFQQPSNTIEALENGTLFSDLLSETFRHQIEQYKILSCYEGIGDVHKNRPCLVHIYSHH